MAKNFRILVNIFCVALLVMLFSVEGRAELTYPEIYDIIDARNYCDSNPLHRIEGIWEYPEDGVTVLIKRDDFQTDTYNIIALESKSSVYNFGEIIGYATATTDPVKYKMNLFTKRNKNILSNPRSCAVILSNDDAALRIEKASFKFSFNPLFLLSGFWKVARVSYKNPSAELPLGMKKVYPSYDGNGSSKFNARYL